MKGEGQWKIIKQKNAGSITHTHTVQFNPMLTYNSGWWIFEDILVDLGHMVPAVPVLGQIQIITMLDLHKPFVFIMLIFWSVIASDHCPLSSPNPSRSKAI